MKKIFIILSVIGISFILGCRQQESSRYAVIAIPQYSINDYCNLLGSKNLEIVYNAVCNLLDDASSIAATLSDKKSDRKSKEYIGALNVFNKIILLLKSKNEKVVASSLRFLQLFSENYDRRQDLIEPVLRVKSRSTNVQFEQIIALTRMASKDSRIDDSFLRKLLGNKSWLVSRAAYLLIDRLEDDQMRIELVSRYKAIDSEPEKLLILTALRHGFSDKVFEFMTDEILTSRNSKIKNTIFQSLQYGQKQDGILKWMGSNYNRLTKEDIAGLFNTYADAYNNFSTALLIIILKNGFVPEPGFFNKLKESISELEGKKDISLSEKERLANILKIQQELLSKDNLKKIWLPLRDKPQICKEMQQDYNNAVDTFVSKTGEILKRYKMDNDKGKDFINSLFSLKDALSSQLDK